MRWFTLALAALSCGCGNLFSQHARMMDVMRGAMSETAARLGESGAGQIAAGGQVINPGIRVAAGVEYFAEARYEGLTGQVQAAMNGPLDRAVSPQVQTRIDAIWRDSSMSAEKKLILIHELVREWLASAQQPIACASSQPAGENGHAE